MTVEVNDELVIIYAPLMSLRNVNMYKGKDKLGKITVRGQSEDGDDDDKIKVASIGKKIKLVGGVGPTRQYMLIDRSDINAISKYSSFMDTVTYVTHNDPASIQKGMEILRDAQLKSLEKTLSEVTEIHSSLTNILNSESAS